MEDQLGNTSAPEPVVVLSPPLGLVLRPRLIYNVQFDSTVLHGDLIHAHGSQEKLSFFNCFDNLESYM